MKKSFVKTAFALLAVLSASQTSWAQLATQAVGTETWNVAENTAVKADGEVEYYASANIAVLFGANNKWEPAVQRLKDSGDDTYYIRSQNGPSRADKQGLTMFLIPDQGNYFHLRFFVGGKITINFAYSSKKDKRNMYSVYMQDGKNQLAKNFSATVDGTTYSQTDVKDKQGNITDSYVELPATGTTTVTTTNKDGSTATKEVAIIKSGTLTFDANAGEDYYLWISSTEEFSFGGFSFDVNADNRFNAFEPNVHEHIVFGKPKNAATPTGAENITMMYGGWLSHTNGVKSATSWDESSKTWTYMPNGTEDTQYDGKTDMWVKATGETSLTTLDGFVNYTSGCGNNPTDGNYNAFVPKNGAATLPCRGTYYKFEPEKDGFLTVYVRQNASQPLYFVDESGVPQTTDDAVAGQGDDVITKQSDDSYVASQLSVCRYSFEVKAGKTYFLFQNGAELGFFGFTFGASETATTNVQLDNITKIDNVANAKVSYTRNFKNGVWNTIVLPFSMTEAEVRAAFGDKTEVSEFSNIDSNGKVHFVQNYYRLIEAGKPYIIKPSKEGITDFTTVACVTMSAAEPQSISGTGYDFVGTYASETMPVGSYYFTAQNNVSGIARVASAKQTGTFRAYLKPTSASANALQFNFDNSTTGISEVKAQKVADGNIYNLQGVLVAKDGDFSRLGKGIYVMNGKKYQK